MATTWPPARHRCDPDCLRKPLDAITHLCPASPLLTIAHPTLLPVLNLTCLTFCITCSGHPDLAFTGRLIAVFSSSLVLEHCQ